MAYILHIETSGTLCSVAVSADEVLLAEATGSAENDHAAQLTILIGNALQTAGINPGNLHAVAVSEGPGSYTGLRIGTSTAKGICQGLNIPLIAVDTLLAMAAGVADKYKEIEFFCPLIDARRMEVFTAVYNRSGAPMLKPCSLIADEQSVKQLLKNGKTVFFGSGLEKCKPYLQQENAIPEESHIHTAKYMIRTASKKFNTGDFADVIYFEPAYLKEVYTTTPAK